MHSSPTTGQERLQPGDDGRHISPGSSSRCRSPSPAASGGRLGATSRVPPTSRASPHRPPACPMDRSGCSTSGATPRTTRTARTSSTSSASRTSRTTSGRASNVVYLADSGRGRAPRARGRERADLEDGPRRGDPTKVTSLYDPDRGRRQRGQTFGDIHQPDNLETTRTVALHPGGSRARDQFVPHAGSDLDATTRDLAVTNTGVRSSRDRPMQHRPDVDEPRKLGVERDRRRVGGLRPGSVPRRRAGSTPGIETTPGDDNTSMVNRIKLKRRAVSCC